MYEQQRKVLYSSMLVKLPLQLHEATLSYVEVLSETSVDTNHVHDCYEICFCLENSVTVKAGSREYDLSPGEFLFIMPGTPHNVEYTPAEKKKYLIMVFEMPPIDKDDEQDRPLATKINKLSCLELAVRGVCQVDEIRELLDKMEKELAEKKTGWLFLFRGYCLEFLILCFRDVLEPLNESPGELKNLNLAIEITKYMQNNYNHKITLQDIADAMYISPRHAQRIFKDFFGVNYAQTLRLYRMNYAKDYLVKTNLTIDEIAERVGLSSAQALYKHFREQERMSINEYRAMQRSISRDMQAGLSADA